MSGALWLALRHASHHLGRTLLLVLSVGVTAFLPLATRVLSRQFEASLRGRAAETPLVAGARGSRFDLVMAQLYFRRADLPTVSMADWQSLQESGLADAIPLNIRFTARSRPIVCTPVDYFSLRRLRAGAGALPRRIGDVVLGAKAARALGLGPGDTIFSDQRELYDIAKAPALKMHITGVLSPTGGPDDECLFADIKTAWVLEGTSHGHADAAKVPASLTLDKAQNNTVVSEAMVDYNEVTDQNLASFHSHGDASTLALSGVILVPHSIKDESIIKARYNAKDKLQIVVPREVVDELIGQVLRLRGLMDALALVIGVVTALLIALVAALSARVRAREIETLHKIGASRGTIRAVFGFEMLVVVISGAILAGLAGALLAWSPLDLVKLL